MSSLPFSPFRSHPGLIKLFGSSVLELHHSAAVLPLALSHLPSLIMKVLVRSELPLMAVLLPFSAKERRTGHPLFRLRTPDVGPGLLRRSVIRLHFARMTDSSSSSRCRVSPTDIVGKCDFQPVGSDARGRRTSGGADAPADLQVLRLRLSMSGPGKDVPSQVL